MMHQATRIRAASLLRLFGSAVLILLASATAHAQGYNARDVQREIDRTTEVIMRASDIVRPSAVPRAIDLLERAVNTQQGAVDRFRQAQYGAALLATREARRLALYAVDVARNRIAPGSGPMDLEPRAQHDLEGTRRAFDRARECAGDPPSALAQRVLDLAATRLDEARQAYRDRRYALAVQIAQQVDRILEDVCSGPRRENVDLMIETVERLLDRATPQVMATGNENAAHLLEQSRTLLGRARELAASRNHRLAMQQARQARELTLQALRLCELPPDPQSVAQLLDDAAQDLQTMAQAVRENGNPEATKLMERALDHLARAQAAQRQARPRMALAELRVARNLAFRAARLAGVSDL